MAGGPGVGSRPAVARERSGVSRTSTAGAAAISRIRRDHRALAAQRRRRFWTPARAAPPMSLVKVHHGWRRGCPRTLVSLPFSRRPRLVISMARADWHRFPLSKERPKRPPPNMRKTAIARNGGAPHWRACLSLAARGACRGLASAARGSACASLAARIARAGLQPALGASSAWRLPVPLMLGRAEAVPLIEVAERVGR